MDGCITLAATGSNYGLVGIVGILLVVGAGIVMRRKSIRIRHIVVLVGIMLSPLIPAYDSYAAQADCSRSQPDTSTGVIGAKQVYNVLANDQPTPGAAFVMSSLRLALVDNPVVGSTLSDDEKQVTAPSEGTYVAGDNGTVTYTPDAQFVGRTKGVRYLVKDTADNTISNIYQPIVTDKTPPVTACTAFNQEAAFGNIDINMVDRQSGAFPIVSGVEAFGPTYISRSGQNIVFAQSDKLMYTTDRGVSWHRSVQDASNMTMIAGNADSSLLVAGTPSGSNKLVSRDFGATWSELPNSSFDANLMTVSASGQAIYAVKDGYIYRSLDSGITWSTVLMRSSMYTEDISTSADGAKVIAVGWPGQVITSTDYGATWQVRSNPGAIVNVYSPYITDINDAGTQMLVTSTGVDKLFASTDDGASWNERTDGTSRNLVSASSTGTGILAKGPNGYAISNDGGYTWTPKNVADNHGIGYASDDFTVLTDHGTSALYVSTDSGASWKQFVYYDQVEAAYIDIDTSTPGLQRTIDRSTTEGWVGSYDPTTDMLTISVVDETLFRAAEVYTLEYSMWAEGCSQPTPGIIRITSRSDIINE